MKHKAAPTPNGQYAPGLPEITSRTLSDDPNAALTALVVDLDGTLTPTDTLVESLLQLVKRHPLDVLRLPFRLLKGRATFKEFIARRSGLSAGHLPYQMQLLDYLRSEKEKGHRIVLATAAHRDIARAVAAHLGLFDEVLASDEMRNLKGPAKLEAIRGSVGDNFIYAADSRSDLPIWKAAKAAILVGASSGVAEDVRRHTPIEREFPREHTGLAIWLRALRVQQWLKNLLLFVPLLTSFSFLEGTKQLTVVVSFLAFSFAASATYLVNDLLDLESDRAHPRKRYRPFARGEISILKGIAVAVSVLAVALVLAAAVSKPFALMLLLYLVLTTSYSWMLKEYVVFDVLMLSLLYTLRILAGSVAVGVTTSSWLLAFSVFIFFSLALVKRCSELVSLSQIGQNAAVGRDYRTSDLIVLWPLGVGSALCAVVVFGLFINASETQVRYGTPEGLWVVAIALLYWLSRIWVKTARGEMNDDPVVFAIRDFGSLMTILAMVITTLVAHLVIF